jgi:hypothetical protein
MVQGPGCKLGAVSAESFVREAIQWITLHYADVHYPGGCIDL